MPLPCTVNFGRTPKAKVAATWSVRKCRRVNDGVTASLTEELVSGDAKVPSPNEAVVVVSSSAESSVWM